MKKLLKYSNGAGYEKGAGYIIWKRCRM